MSYPYILPTTGAISWSEQFNDPGPYARELSDATALRGRLRAVLKETKRLDEGNKDLVQIMKTVEEYIPYLLGIVTCIEEGLLKPKTEIETSWRSTMTSTMLKVEKPRIECKGIYYELIFTLLTYGYTCSLWASSIIGSIRVGVEEKSYNKASELLCQAGEIFLYIAEEVCPKWVKPPSNRPPDTTNEICTALAKISLADAEAIGIRKNILLKRPSSNALIAKLYLDVALNYEMANGLVLSSVLKLGELSTDFRKYLTEGILFYKAMAKKHLAMDASDNQNVGNAVGFIQEAKDSIHTLKKPLIPSRGAHSVMGTRAAQEEEEVNRLHSEYTKLNDTVLYQAVPSKSQLQELIPSARSLLSLKKFAMPQEAFGPHKESVSSNGRPLYGNYY